jgi:hypothetical protein
MAIHLTDEVGYTTQDLQSFPTLLFDMGSTRLGGGSSTLTFRWNWWVAIWAFETPTLLTNYIESVAVVSPRPIITP